MLSALLFQCFTFKHYIILLGQFKFWHILYTATFHRQYLLSASKIRWRRVKYLLVNYYLMNLSIKFYKDRSFRWGDITLFVTLYNLEVEIFSVFSFWILAKSRLSFKPLEMVNIIILFDNINQKPAIEKITRRTTTSERKKYLQVIASFR